MNAAMKTPWHLWIVGILSLLWNCMGAMDYIMTKTKNEAYLSGFTPEQLAYFDSFPAWIVAFWAIAVFFAVAGSILLLFRRFWAVPVFGISLIAMAVTTLHSYLLSDIKPQEISGDFAMWFSVAIAVIAILLWLYARYLAARGILR